MRGGTDRVEVEGVELLDDRVLLIELGRGRRHASGNCNACQQEAAGEHPCFCRATEEGQASGDQGAVPRQRGEGARDPYLRYASENREEQGCKFNSSSLS